MRTFLMSALLFMLFLFGQGVYATDVLEDASPHTIGNLSCDVTEQVVYYAGASNINFADNFSASSSEHWKLSVADSRYSLANPHDLLSLLGFNFASNWKPINVGSVVAVVSDPPASIGSAIPSSYTSRNTIAAQIIYHIVRAPYISGPLSQPYYYTPVGGSTQNGTLMRALSSLPIQEDNECHNVHVAFCGDGITDNTTTQSSSTITAPLAGNEECDDGNTDPFDDCVTYTNGTAVCALPYCGDGYIQPGEDCDDGNNIDGDGCPSDCIFPPVPGVCGSTYHNQQIYDFDNNGNALTATTPGLCATGTVTSFLYNTANHSWSWTCAGANEGADASCQATEQRCGDGLVNMMEGEQCDGDAADCGPGQFTCTSACTCVANPLDGVCGSTYDGQSFYDFDNNGNYLTATTPGLCANGQITGFSYSAIEHERTRTCQGSNGGSPDSCQATELRCGDDTVNGAEACDGDATVCGPSGQFTCTNACACLPNQIDGVCGSVDDAMIYDFDNNGNALTATSPGLCADGNVSVFLYNAQTHIRSRQCVGMHGGDTAFCAAQEQRCGDGVVNGAEACDGDATVCGPGQWTCATCTCIENPLDGVCGSTYDGQSFYDFDNNGNYLTVTTPGLCANGQISNFVYNPTTHVWTRTCQGSNGGIAEICQATELRCGDGVVNGAEACDDGNTIDTDACRNDCTLPSGGGSSCDSLTVTSTTQNVPTQIGYTCLGQGSDILVELFGSTGGLLATSTTAVGSFSVTTPDTYMIVCSYDGITSPACIRNLDLGGYCKDLVASLTTGTTYTFACSGIGDNYQLVITDSQNHVVTTATATGDFTYTYTFMTPGTYTAICFVDGVSNMTCTDGTGFTTQAYSTAFGGNTVGVLRTSPTTRIVSAPQVDYRANGFSSLSSLSASLEDHALAKWMKTYISTLDPKTITSVAKPNITVVKTDFAKKIDDITTSVGVQLTQNCYNACLETIVIGGGSTGSCLLTTNPTTTRVKASSLTVTGTCAFFSLPGTPSLACGNGTVLTGTSGVCLYTGYGTWTMQCLLDDKAYPGCEKPIQTYKGGGGGGGGGGRHGWCGDGIVDPGEQCDEGEKNGIGSICSTSCTLKGVNPGTGTSDGITPPKCAFVDPPSIQLGEILPFWRDTEENSVISECKSGSDEGKIDRNSLRCYFTIKAPGGETIDEIDKPCMTDELSSVKWYDDLQADLKNRLLSHRGKSYIETAKWKKQVYGEYTITLDKIGYALCTQTKPATTDTKATYNFDHGKSYEGRVCQYNFAVTTPYLIQKGTSLSSFADDRAKLSNFLTINGETILELTDINLLDKTSTTTAFDNLKETLSKEAKKAVSSVNVADSIGIISTSFKKAPNQELYVIDKGFTINVGKKIDQFNGGKPTTLLVQGNVTVDIIGSLPGNLLLLAPEGRVRFVNDDCDATDTISATIVAAHVETSLAVTNANRSVDNKERCTDGKLVIKGVLITKRRADVAAVRDARRSTLNNRFDGKKAKAEHIYAGASLRIESRPEKRTEQPPLATKNSLFFTTQSHGSAGDQLPLPLPILESLLVLFEEF